MNDRDGRVTEVDMGSRKCSASGGEREVAGAGWRGVSNKSIVVGGAVRSDSRGAGGRQLNGRAQGEIGSTNAKGNEGRCGLYLFV